MTPIRRNAMLLALGLVFQSGMIQLAVALGGGVVYTGAGNASLALTAAGLALLPAAWTLGAATVPEPATA